MENFDYVIVGGGTAGSLLARRLIEAGATVCVLESGPSDRHPFVYLPAGFLKTLLNAKRTWRYKTDGGPGSGGRKIPMVHGRMLGGSSSVNGMAIVRGQAQDYDGWAEAGNPGWSFADVLPYFKKLERRIGAGDDDYRGRDGLLPVTDNDWRHPLCEAFIDSAASLGLPRETDYNGASQSGTGYYQRNILHRTRYSTARSYLTPILKHPNLSVRTRAHATRLLLEGKRAVGVSYLQGADASRSLEVRANKDVIICTGAVATPKLLQISGIGPGAVLNDIGVPVLHALAGVGENLRDHYTPRVIMRAKAGTSTINSISRGPNLAAQVLKWSLGQPSILGVSPALTYAFCKSEPDLKTPDIAIIFTPGSYKGGVLGLLDDFPGLTCGGWQLRPESSGYVRARSTDPFKLPQIQPNYLSNEKDRKVVVASLKIARKILAAPAMAKYLADELSPGVNLQSDDELLDYARQTGTTCCHPVGTSQMGPSAESGAVVDAQLRVHGLDALRIVDASIMPMMPSGNTNAPTMMIAEKAAAMITGRGAV